MLPNIQVLLVYLIFPLITFSCTSTQGGNHQKGEITNAPAYKAPPELTQEQQFAFDALNKLQISTDEKNRLYSTFPNIEQPCYPADTSFEISQSEFLIVMEQFIAKHCQNLSPEVQNELAQSSVLAQNKYKVLHCIEDRSNSDLEKGLPMTGTWVLPNVLERRDVTIVW